MYNILFISLEWNQMWTEATAYTVEISKCWSRVGKRQMRPKQNPSLGSADHPRTRAGSHNGDRFQDSRKGRGGARVGRGPHWGAGLVRGEPLLVFTYKISWLYFLEIHTERKEDLIITL